MSCICVIICTYNPDAILLNRVLEGLRQQTLAYEQWTLLLIDNASEIILSKKIDLTWHPKSFHIREETLGLTHARLKGIEASAADIIVFVDDDNILDPSYLENVLDIAKQYPCLGAWGGNIIPEFEKHPPKWFKNKHFYLLSLREVAEDLWSNITEYYLTIPYGAGLCVRRIVADTYAENTRKDSLRINLDRKGHSLSGNGDIDIALTACDIGLGTGLFKNLTVKHIIPVKRLKKDYLLKLMEGAVFSHTILTFIRYNKYKQSKNLLTKVKKLIKWIFSSIFDKQLQLAYLQGEKRAIKLLKKL